MKLTGKALFDFWEWYLLPKQRETYKTSSIRGNDSVIKVRFLAMSEAEQWGVIQDWADSVEINDLWVRRVDGRFRSSSHEYFNTRQEARTAAIEKLNELYNER